MREIFGERRNITLFYLLTAVMSFYFIAANWLYFWSRYMTYGQLGWVDALGFGFGLLLEVPSGAIADLLGKRKTILFGMIAGTVGVFIITFSDSAIGIFLGWMVAQFCYAFYSGAAEALTYDSLVDLKEQHKFDKVITNASAIESYVGAATMLLGGFLYVVNFRLPHILWGVGFAIGIPLAWLLIEPRVDSTKFSLKKYFQQLTVGFKELTHTELRRYIGFFFVLVGVYFMYSWGLIRPAMATGFGFFSEAQGIILPALVILGAIVVKFIPAIRRKMSDISGLFILSIAMAIGFISSAFFNNYWGILSLIMIGFAGKLASPWISIIVNKKIESKFRATTLSTVALITKLPYVLLAVIAGIMIQNNRLAQFDIAVGVVVLIVGIMSFLLVVRPKVKKS